MAATDRPSLTVDERTERGSRATRRLRRDGFVPGVVYGGATKEPLAFQVGARDLRAALHGSSQVIDLKIGSGSAVPVILKEQQNHPVRGEIVHVDFLGVRLDEKIHSTVPIELEGMEEAPGVKEGGVLEHVTRELNIEALPTDLPERIVVDVSKMDAAATMHLSELDAPQGVQFLDDLEETIIATITVASEVVEEPEIEEETGVVGADGETQEEAEAAAAEGDGGDAGGGDS